MNSISHNATSMSSHYSEDFKKSCESFLDHARTCGQAMKYIRLDTLNGIKTKDRNSMHHLNVGVNIESNIVVSLNRVTHTKCGDKITREDAIYLTPNTARILANELSMVVDTIQAKARASALAKDSNDDEEDSIIRYFVEHYKFD